VPRASRGARARCSSWEERLARANATASLDRRDRRRHRGGLGPWGNPATAQCHRFYDVATSDLGRRAAARPWDGLWLRDRRVARKGAASFPSWPIRSDNCGSGVGRHSSRALANCGRAQGDRARRTTPDSGDGNKGLSVHLGVMGDLHALCGARQPVSVFHCRRDRICRMARSGPADRGSPLIAPSRKPSPGCCDCGGCGCRACAGCGCAPRPAHPSKGVHRSRRRWCSSCNVGLPRRPCGPR